MAAQVTIKETTQADLADEPVGCGNLWDRRYTLPDGSSATGLTAQLFVGDALPIVVGEGSVFDAGGETWRVVRVDKPPEGLGRVVLELAS